MSRPRIGVTMAHDEDGFRLTLREEYVRSLEQAGALAVAIPTLDEKDVPEVLGFVDALLFVGGSDIDPALYGAAPHPKLGRVVRSRDVFEITLCREGLGRDVPTLAICRGLQVLNVALGGTLVQDIPSEVGEGVTHDAQVERQERLHDVQIGEDTTLRRLLGGTAFAVNSIHHQAARELGVGLRVCALSPKDGVIEGIERTDGAFGIGVQWHPEAFWRTSGDFKPLFEAFVAEASR